MYRRFRSWCKSNEPVFRFVEVCVIAVVGIYFAYLQNKAADAQLGVAVLQSRLEQRQFAPDFKFDVDDSGDWSTLTVIDESKRTKSLQAAARYYVEVTNAHDERSRILVDGFFGTPSLALEGNEVASFFYPRRMGLVG